MTNTIETRLSGAIRLLNIAEREYKRGSRQYALDGVKEVTERLLVLAREMQAELTPAPADDALTFNCGHCAHTCNVNELKAGKCPRCGTIRDGVLVVPKVGDWMEEAILRKPQPTGVRLDGFDI